MTHSEALSPAEDPQESWPGLFIFTAALEEVTGGRAGIKGGMVEQQKP